MLRVQEVQTIRSVHSHIHDQTVVNGVRMIDIACQRLFQTAALEVIDAHERLGTLAARAVEPDRQRVLRHRQQRDFLPKILPSDRLSVELFQRHDLTFPFAW